MQQFKPIHSRSGCAARIGMAIFSIVAWAALVSESTAGDWRQILGPTRNGLAQDESLASSWPSGGPRLLWKKEVGHGYAGVAVSAGQVIVFHRQGDQLLGEALEAETGKSQWRITFATRYASSIAADDGPRCVPLVHRG